MGSLEGALVFPKAHLLHLCPIDDVPSNFLQCESSAAKVLCKQNNIYIHLQADTTVSFRCRNMHKSL